MQRSIQRQPWKLFFHTILLSGCDKEGATKHIETLLKMDQVTKLQVVSKKLEKMLETSLQQLKLEQKLRKEGEEKIQGLENQLNDLDQSFRVREEDWHTHIYQKEDKRINLEASTEYLQLMVVQKDDEITKNRR